MPDFNDDFMRDIPRGVTTRHLHDHSVPQARWQPLDTIANSRALAYNPENPGGSILVGALGDKLIGIDDNRHVMTVAGSRSGKSVTVVGNLLHYRGSVLAIDPKGELAAITAARRARLGQKVFVLDPFQRGARGSLPPTARYNPLAVLTLGNPTIIEDAGLIADALVIAGGKDPHWDESAKNFIEGVILHVATDPAFDGRRTLVTVRDLIRGAMKEVAAAKEQSDEVAAFILGQAMLVNAERLGGWAESVELGGVIEGAARDFYEKPDGERGSVLSTVRRHTRFLDSPALRHVLSGHDFDLADLKRDPAGVSVYLCIPASRMGLCNRWLRLFVNQLLAAMEQERAVPQAPVLAILDEFPVLGHMRQLEDAAGQIASFHVKLWVILQDWGQGKALYKDRWETFAGNAGILQFFGNNDLATTEYVSKRLGKTAVQVTRIGEAGLKQVQEGLSGRSESVELHDLMRPEEIAKNFARSDRLKRQLVIWAGFDPMILQRVEYFDTASPVHGAFQGLYGRVG